MMVRLYIWLSFFFLVLFSCKSDDDSSSELLSYQVGKWKGVEITEGVRDSMLQFAYTYSVEIDLNSDGQGLLLQDSLIDPQRVGFDILSWEIENFDTFDKISYVYEKEISGNVDEFPEKFIILKNSYNYQEWTQEGTIINGSLEGTLITSTWHLNRIE
jgi:hypothetical protein